MARRSGRRGGIIKLYPPPLASQQPAANHQPHFMKGGRGGERRERNKREEREKGWEVRGRIKERRTADKERRKARRKEKEGDVGKMVSVGEKWDNWREGGRE